MNFAFSKKSCSFLVFLNSWFSWFFHFFIFFAERFFPVFLAKLDSVRPKLIPSLHRVIRVWSSCNQANKPYSVSCEHTLRRSLHLIDFYLFHPLLTNLDSPFYSFRLCSLFTLYQMISVLPLKREPTLGLVWWSDFSNTRPKIKGRKKILCGIFVLNDSVIEFSRRKWDIDDETSVHSVNEGLFWWAEW